MKVVGELKFGIDLKIDGMMFASVKLNPNKGQPLKSYDASKAQSMPGVFMMRLSGSVKFFWAFASGSVEGGAAFGPGFLRPSASRFSAASVTNVGLVCCQNGGLGVACNTKGH